MIFICRRPAPRQPRPQNGNLLTATVANTPCVTLVDSIRYVQTRMIFSKEYVGYLARQVTHKLIAGNFIETKQPPAVSAALNTVKLEELQLEDRINDEVLLILAHDVEVQPR